MSTSGGPAAGITQEDAVSSGAQFQQGLGLGDDPFMTDFSSGAFLPDLDLGSLHDHTSQLHTQDNSVSPIQASIENAVDQNQLVGSNGGSGGGGQFPQSNINQNNSGSGSSDRAANDISMADIGAGPLPTGFGVPLPPNVGSTTLTEFTKRRNWSQRVVEELKDFLHILTPDCRIMYVSPSAKALTNYDAQSLVGKFMTSFIHPDDSTMFVREFNESIASGNPLRFFYRFRKPDGTFIIFESHGHPHFSSEAPNFGGSNHGVSFCRGFFMMARPYPTKNAALLDSFLEHKIENERLKKRIADLKREEEEDIQQQYNTRTNMQAGNSSSVRQSFAQAPADSGARPAGSGDGNNAANNAPPSPKNYNGMPPPAKPGISNYALTQRNLDEALSASRPDSINDKMARYEGANHYEGIEMLTGLHYREGERSKGISTGEMSPILLRDHASEIPDKEGRLGTARGYSSSPMDAEKKKKMKVADEYVCTDCGTLDSPEWRRGPAGPKTLCNACGLRWAKQEKKRSGQSHGGSNNNNGNNNNINSGHSISQTNSRNSTVAASDALPSGTSPMQGSSIGGGTPSSHAAASDGVVTMHNEGMYQQNPLPQNSTTMGISPMHSGAAQAQVSPQGMNITAPFGGMHTMMMPRSAMGPNQPPNQ